MNSRDVLGCLKVFPFGLYGRGNNHLDFMHFSDVSGTTYSHAGAQSADQVLGAVGDGSRTEKNLLQRSGSAHSNTCPSG